MASLSIGYEPQPMFDRRAFPIYAIIATELGLSVILYSALGLRFADISLAMPSVSIIVVLVSSWASRRGGFQRIATWLEATALAYLSGLAGWALFYPGTVWALPYADPWLSAADRALGFDFPALYRATKDWPWMWIYRSFEWQPAAVILTLVLAKRNPWPLVLTMSIALAFTIFTYPFAPAIGPVGYYHLGPAGSWTHMIEALRDHGERTIRLDMLVGMVSLPSFHCSVGLLIVWVTWPLKYLRWPLVALNGGMIVSTIPYGQHYLIDVIGGLLVAVVAIGIYERGYAAVGTVKPESDA